MYGYVGLGIRWMSTVKAHGSEKKKEKEKRGSRRRWSEGLARASAAGIHHHLISLQPQQYCTVRYSGGDLTTRQTCSLHEC